jgi:hypothetical protein
MLSGLWIPRAALFAAAQNNPPEPATSTQPSTLIHDSLPPDKLQESYDLYLTSGVLYVTTVWGFLVLYAMLRAQFGTRLGDLAVRASRFRVVQAAVVMSLFFPVVQIVQLPFDAYEHHIGLQYGLPVQHWDWGSWFGDWAHSYCWAVASRDGPLCDTPHSQTVVVLLLEGNDSVRCFRDFSSRSTVLRSYMGSFPTRGGRRRWRFRCGARDGPRSS